MQPSVPVRCLARRICAGKSPDVHAVFSRRPRCQRRCRRVAVCVAGALSPNVSRALPRAVEKSSIPVRSRASHLKIGRSMPVIITRLGSEPASLPSICSPKSTARLVAKPRFPGVHLHRFQTIHLLIESRDLLSMPSCVTATFRERSGRATFCRKQGSPFGYTVHVPPIPPR